VEILSAIIAMCEELKQLKDEIRGKDCKLHTL